MGLGFNLFKRVLLRIGVVFFFIHASCAFAGNAPAGIENAVEGPAPEVHAPKIAEKKMPAEEVAPSEKGTPGAKKPGSGDVHISADKLVSTRDDFTAEFSGNVLATQAGATIRSDRLRVHYEKKPDKHASDDGSGSNLGSNRIKEIVAEGNVKIEMNNRTAFCDRAVYHVPDGLILLTGNDVRISQDENFIHGSRITLNRQTGGVSVSGDQKKRVEAVFNPGTKVKTPELPRPQKTD